MTDLRELLTAPEAAAFLGVSAQTVRNWTRRGQLAHVETPSGRALYREEDLQAVLTVRGGS